MGALLSKLLNGRGTLGLIGPLFIPLCAGTAGYTAWKINWPVFTKYFFTGPGRTSRILLAFFILTNWKNMPLVWTSRILYALSYHNTLRPSPDLKPNALFKPIITTEHAPLLEIDYNMHKSNSTFFSDVDISRTNLVAYLFRRALRQLDNNVSTKLILDPATGAPFTGGLSIIVGAVECSFHREIPGYKPYEMWSRVLSWDRKWLYIVTHFVRPGTARPTSWLDPAFRGRATRAAAAADAGWQKNIYATALTRYILKVGRFTVHPAILLDQSGLLPERPGGWREGENKLGDEGADVSDVDLDDGEGEWDWRRVEAKRRKGFELVAQFSGLDALQGEFDGGKQGALAKFGLF